MSSARLSSSILAAPRPQTAAAPRPPQLPSTPRRAAAAPAKRRPTETAYFEDIFDPLFETINGNQGLTLPDRDMRTLLASTNTAEQLEKTLGLLEKQVMT